MNFEDGEGFAVLGANSSVTDIVAVTESGRIEDDDFYSSLDSDARFIYYIVLCIVCASCDIEDPIKLEKHFFEVDYKAQDVIINADAKIITMLYDYSESDVDHSNNNANLKEYRDGSIKYIECEWFRMALDVSDPYHICISLDKNQSNKDRKVKNPSQSPDRYR